ncbi:MAG: glutamate racemase [Bdellovibrionales bacterium RIFOXYD1_FULL_44_7]|nr:MAG: glutamate racemase [Bdellovibrionales bacterium RIFOXYD1_FULL_44_7]
MKIGVFDSGIGGITVLSELRKMYPGEEYVYFGDTAHVPYGTRSPAQIRQLSSDCARTLKSRKINALVVACNTASSLALEQIRDVMQDIPVFGVVEPGVEAALEASSFLPTGSPILVLATKATIKSGAYRNALKKCLSGAHKNLVREQACPLLVPMIEEGWIDHPILDQVIDEYVKGHVQDQTTGVALLGCTHYPWILSAIQKALPKWVIVNSAQACAKMLQRSAIGKKMIDAAVGARSGSEGKAVEWIFTDPDAVPLFAQRLIN